VTLELELVRLVRATQADHQTLANLLELYIHDLSAMFSIDVGPDGRFGYAPLARYWQEPETRHAFLITAGEHIAGFALAARGSPLSADPNVLDVAEFFVLRAHRRTNVGRRAALLLWDAMPGAWIVRVAETNTSGLGFWRAAVSEYTGREDEGRVVALPDRNWRVFEFASGS
jgi:predicted acetyltransferase